MMQWRPCFAIIIVIVSILKTSIDWNSQIKLFIVPLSLLSMMLSKIELNIGRKVGFVNKFIIWIVIMSYHDQIFTSAHYVKRFFAW